MTQAAAGNQGHRTRRLVLAALVGLAVLGMSTVAEAKPVTPRPGPWGGETTPRGGKDDSAEFIIKANKLTPLTIFPGWSAIIAPTSFKCNEAYIQLPIKRLSIVHGRFAYHGPATDTAGNKSTGVSGELTWTGSFTSPTKVKGTMRFQTPVTPVFDSTSYTYSLEPKACDTGVLPWSGKLGKSLQ